MSLLSEYLQRYYAKLPKAAMKDIPEGSLVIIDYQTVPNDEADDCAVYAIVRQNRVSTRLLEVSTEGMFGVNPLEITFKNTQIAAYVPIADYSKLTKD